MKMRRIVTAESKSGVVVQASDLLESKLRPMSPPISGGSTSFRPCPSQLSRCSASTSERASSVQRRLRVVIQSLPPEKAPAPDLGPLIAKLDFGTGHGMTQANQAVGCTGPTASTSWS